MTQGLEGGALRSEGFEDGFDGSGRGGNDLFQPFRVCDVLFKKQQAFQECGRIGLWERLGVYHDEVLGDVALVSGQHRPADAYYL